jgi:diguanylate cyclase (GGDEF)-like protein
MGAPIDLGPSGSVTSARTRHGSLARRLRLAITALLVPLVAVTVVGVVMFRSSIAGLEAVHRESVDEAALVDHARDLMSAADDLGERHVEDGDATAGEEFLSISRQVDATLDRLEAMSSLQETAIMDALRAQWSKVVADVDAAAGTTEADVAEVSLDAFHDDLDEALSTLAGLYAIQGLELADELGSMHRHEQLQLGVELALLVVGLGMAALVASWARRSITVRLGMLESAAERFGTDDLVHRIDVGGDDELTRVGDAFNGMAGKLHLTRSELRHRALHDELTGLPNRAKFMDELEAAQVRAARRGGCFALLYLDLDGFKQVNDSWGHHVGDELLRIVATRLRACLRPGDGLARLGGDEFGVLLDDVDATRATEIADRIVEALGTIDVASHALVLGVSVGITTALAGDDIDDVIQQADSSMYSVKARGGGAWSVFDADGHRREGPLALHDARRSAEPSNGATPSSVVDRSPAWRPSRSRLSRLSFGGATTTVDVARRSVAISTPRAAFSPSRAPCLLCG